MDFLVNFVKKHPKITVYLFIIDLLVLMQTPESLKIYLAPLSFVLACMMFMLIVYTMFKHSEHEPNKSLNKYLSYAAVPFFIVLISQYLLPEHYYFYWQIAVGFTACPLVLLILYAAFKEILSKKKPENI